jgi:competence protein ComFC
MPGSKQSVLGLWVDDVLSLGFPHQCAACGGKLIRQEKVICTLCLAEMPLTHYSLEKENPVSQVFWGRVPVEGAISLFHFRKQSHFQHLLHQLKYKGRKDVGIELGRQLGFKILSSVEKLGLTMIVPVPLHPKREKKRGYNQADMIARGISEATGIPNRNDVILRNVATQTQTKKSRIERWQNVENIFVIKDEKQIKNAHILLVDDVVTTGATLEACAQTLLLHKGVRVSIATLAQA